MRQLTETQKEFLLEYFFKNDNFAGWKNIATSLLENGSCVVAGTNCIWCGGIGNFIKTNNAIGFVDCLIYKFDLEYFLTSAWYKEIKSYYELELEDKMEKLQKEYQDLCNLC